MRNFGTLLLLILSAFSITNVKAQSVNPNSVPCLTHMNADSLFEYVSSDIEYAEELTTEQIDALYECENSSICSLYKAQTFETNGDIDDSWFHFILLNLDTDKFEIISHRVYIK